MPGAYDAILVGQFSGRLESFLSFCVWCHMSKNFLPTILLAECQNVQNVKLARMHIKGVCVGARHEKSENPYFSFECAPPH